METSKWSHLSLIYNWSIQDSVVSSVNGATKHKEIIAQIKKGHFNKH